MNVCFKFNFIKMVSVYNYSRFLMCCFVFVILMFVFFIVFLSFLIFLFWLFIFCWILRVIDFRFFRMLFSLDIFWLFIIFFEDWIEICDDWFYGCIGVFDWLLLVMWLLGWFILGGVNFGFVFLFFLWKSCFEIREFI